jgi:flagellar operon protein
MDNRIQNSQIADLLQGQTITPASPATQAGTPAAPAGEFGKILQDQLKVSGHAQTRMTSRNIELSDSEWQRVMGGVQKAAAKGAKESLVMVDNVALVVSVKNRTVITAVDKDNLKDNVFTNIDSAVIV